MSEEDLDISKFENLSEREGFLENTNDYGTLDWKGSRRPG